MIMTVGGVQSKDKNVSAVFVVGCGDCCRTAYLAITDRKGVDPKNVRIEDIRHITLDLDTGSMEELGEMLLKQAKARKAKGI